MSREKLWTEERIAELRHLAEDLLQNSTEISRRFGCSRNAIRMACQRYGIRILNYGVRVSMKNAGNRFYEARRAAGLTMEEAAERIGVVRQTITHWESGDRIHPNLAKFAAEAYGVSVDDLLGEEVIDVARRSDHGDAGERR